MTTTAGSTSPGCFGLCRPTNTTCASDATGDVPCSRWTTSRWSTRSSSSVPTVPSRSAVASSGRRAGRSYPRLRHRGPADRQGGLPGRHRRSAVARLVQGRGVGLLVRVARRHRTARLGTARPRAQRRLPRLSRRQAAVDAERRAELLHERPRLASAVSHSSRKSRDALRRLPNARARHTRSPTHTPDSRLPPRCPPSLFLTTRSTPFRRADHCFPVTDTSSCRRESAALREMRQCSSHPLDGRARAVQPGARDESTAHRPARCAFCGNHADTAGRRPRVAGCDQRKINVISTTTADPKLPRNQSLLPLR